MTVYYRFDPDRFNRKIPAFGFEPFGFAGKRKCPGYRLTELEAQMLLVLALKQFKVGFIIVLTIVSYTQMMSTTADCDRGHNY